MTSFLQSFVPPKQTDLPPRKREKSQLSCTLCRKRKLKCDRASPCNTCVKRGLSLSCAYVQSNKPRKSVTNNPKLRTHASLQERISQLENLAATQLKGLEEECNGKNQSVDFPPSYANVEADSRRSLPLPSSDKGRISVKQDGTTWVESDHWSAILDGISELKDSLESESMFDQSLESSDVRGPDLLLGEQHQIQEHDILGALPPRPVADRLVSQFIKSVEIASMVVHIPTFLKEYEYFWDHQAETPVMWKGLLFGIFCLATLHQQSGFEPVENPSQVTQAGSDAGLLAQLYRKKTVQCLVMGNYSKPCRYAIETLLLYLHIEYVRSQDAQTGLWILLGVTIRLALRMGYHRDGADFYPKISPFHAEIRRRVWCVLVMMDCGASSQFGLPRMIQSRQSNTAPPRHLLDDDIREDMSELPPARPDSMSTTVQYFVFKNQLISEFGHIAELKTLTKQPDYAEILRIDGNLQSIYDRIPPSLVMRPMSKTILDSPSQIIHRVYVALLFFRSRCTLHQTYLAHSWTNQFYKYSRTACCEAALEILHIQQMLDQEIQFGGRLYEDRGKVSSTVRSDFLVATTILCVDANHILTKPTVRNPEIEDPDDAANTKVLAALRKAHQIWMRSCSSSKEAQLAARAIEIVLAKAAPEPNTPSAATWDGMTLTDGSSETNENCTFEDMVMAVNPILYAGLHGETEDFPELLGLDLEMGDLGEYELPSSTKGLDTTTGDNQEDFAWMLSNDHSLDQGS